MKSCRDCGEVKAPTEFYRHPMMGDGRLGSCKACRIAYQRARVRRGLTQEIDRRRRAANPKRREQLRQAARSWTERNRLGAKAQAAVHNEVRRGRLVRQPCEVCGVTNVHAHHPDYSKPLEVRWLCPLHHARVHAGGV